jgi:hypothetical protein
MGADTRPGHVDAAPALRAQRTCYNCMFWCPPDGEAASPTHGICAKLGRAGFRSAWATDSSGLEAAVMTGPDFACIHFNDFTYDRGPDGKPKA